MAAGCGIVHGAFSLLWALGGNWLLPTVGAQLVATFEGRRLLLLPVAAVKFGFAVVPLIWSVRGWPRGWFWSAGCWLGAAILIGWGGLNTVIGNAVLAGIIRPDGGFDRLAMIGHAWLWDPLFLIWGLALVIGLITVRRRRIDRPGEPTAQSEIA